MGRRILRSSASMAPYKNLNMIETDLARIESSLGITLPSEYRELMLARGEELKEIGERQESFAETLFLDPERLILENQSERQPEMGTAYAFPIWWKKFVLVGTNGGGDYYSLRLEGDEHVWMIGSDCGAKPKKKFKSFSDFVNNTIQSYENPEPLPSSFEDACPLPLRFQIFLHTDWDGQSGFCTIRPQEGDRPFTSDKLRSHGILPSDLETCVRSLVAALANGSPASIKLSDQAASAGFANHGDYVVGGFLRPFLADTRLASAKVDVLGGDIYVGFRLKEERAERVPAAKHLKVDWKQFHDGAVRLLEVLHPPGTRVTVTGPKPEAGEAEPRYEWNYVLTYTFKPS
jgi:hypothetical protein